MLTALPGITTLVLAIVLVAGDFESGSGNFSGAAASGDLYAEAGFYLVFALGVLAVSTGLILGKLWARSPAVVVALLTVGVGWYSTGPSDRPAWGIPIMIVGAIVLFLLFQRPARAWALGQKPGETEEDAAVRGGAAGRAEQREKNDRLL